MSSGSDTEIKKTIEYEEGEISRELDDITKRIIEKRQKRV